MKKNYLVALLALICNFAFAQIEQVTYRGAFAPAPAAMWTDSWTNWDPKNTVYADQGTVVNVSGEITANTTWLSGNTYKLSGLVFVKNNATLTIQAGALIKGVNTTTGTALVVTRGAKLNAIGTATAPIVFTSNEPAGSRNGGDWGGIVLLGKARFTSLTSGNTGVNNIEGITASVDTQFGGGTTPDDTDSSGTLKYVRIEFGGYVFSSNNEINGLTMGAVGSGTTIDYVQVSHANDDSFEWFGGAVNCKHIIAYKGLDDDFDADNGYKGFVQFGLVVRDPGLADISESEGFESDNNSGSNLAETNWDNTSAIFSNCTLIGPSGRVGVSVNPLHKRPLRLRRNTQLKVYNSIFMDFSSNHLFIDGSTTVANANAGTLKFQNNIIAGVADATYTMGVNPTSLNSWFTSNNNSYTASAGVLSTPYNTANYNDYNLNGTTIDYRPGTVASSGASFSDPSIAALLPVRNPIVNSKIEQVPYRGAFAPAPAAMWTDVWTNWNPQNTAYTDATNVVTVSGEITSDVTWFTGTTYKLQGPVFVKNNATLTIQPGVVVKGITGSLTNAAALIITRGAKLNAVGTVSAPIVFTSNEPAGSRAAGNWGGVILLGNARYTLLGAANTGVNNIEGLTVSDDTRFGGGTTPDDTDSSGTLKYVRIEFGGVVFSANNEINGLTLGAVGSGTTIDYVQVSHANDDSFEWFGGAVNCKHIVAYRGLDDDFDADNGYKGLVQFGLVVRESGFADSSSSEGFESDNNAGGNLAESGWDNTSAIFSNCTLIGPSGRIGVAVNPLHQRPLRLRRATQLKVYNSIFMDFRTNHLFIDGAAAIANANAGTLKFQNNIISGVADATYTAGVNPTSLNSWFTTNNNSYTASAGILTAPYNTANYNDYNANTVTIDYRPGTLASTGALFSDSSIAPFVAVGLPVTAPVTLCNRQIGIAPLTATLSTAGVSLRWYTSPTSSTFTTTAPIPSSSAVGSRTYYVAEVDASSNVSPRVPLDVTVVAAPVTGLGAITGTLASLPATTSVGLHVGTTTEYVYSVAPAIDETVTKYLWSVPNGVNIIGDDEGNSITVNFANVPAGAGLVGTITVQGVNAAGCPGVVSKIILKKALAAAPSLKMYAVGSVKPTTSFGQFAGTSAPVALVSSTIANATGGYQWELSAGVVPVFGTVMPVTTTLIYTARPFLSPIASAPTGNGSQYWVVTYNTYNGVDVNGVSTKIVTSTAVQKIAGNATYGGTTTAAYLPYGTVITSDKPSIIVSFAGVGSASAIYLGVKSINGVGTSVTINATSSKLATDILANVPGVNYNVYSENFQALIPPSTNATSTYTLTGTTPSTAKLLKVVSVLPLAPSSIRSTIGGLTVTDISTHIGTNNILTLTATAVANASSYTWNLPAGVTQLSGGTSNVITVDYSLVPSGVAPIVIGVRANNNIGSSLLEKTLTLTAALPSIPAVTGSVAICPSAISSKTYTIATVATRATSYNITLPAGATIGGLSTVNIPAVANTTFTVDFVSGFLSPNSAPLTINIQSQNGFGVSLTNRVIKLTNTGAVCGPRLAEPVDSAFSVVAYPNPSSSEFTIVPSAKGAINVKVYDMQGRLVEKSTSTQVGSRLAKGVYNVIVNQGANTKSVRVIKN